MPIYEYECPKCYKVQEIWRSLYETEEARCSECSVEMNKLISKSSFQLKGGGWYADGYCKKNENRTTDNNQPDSTGCSSSSSKDAQACETCHC